MIALFAGTGALPGILAERLVAQGDAPVICEMAGFAPDVRPDLPRLRFRVETLGTLLATLQHSGVTRICLAGAVRRPVIDRALIDAATQPLVALLSAAMAKGDDGTLRGIIALLEAAGFTVVGADQIAPDLIPPPGILTRAAPSAAARAADASVGLAEIARMGQADDGQACVVCDGAVIAREDAAGTDAMLAGLARLAGHDGRASLIKAPKPGQDRRADLPVIGPQTAVLAARAGLAGIIVQAGGVMVIDLPQVLSVLNRHSMFLWVRP